MYRGHKIVCVTPAGRRRYMRLLVPFILRSPLVDEYQIWVNTTNADDIAFFRVVAGLDTRVRLIEPPEHPPEGSKTIGQFFRFCIDPGAIYIRFDDDIVFVADGFFEALLDFRIANPQYFLVSPLVVNNALCTYILQVRAANPGDFTLHGYINPHVFDAIGWRSPVFAEHLHRLFIDKLSTNALGEWAFPHQEFGVGRFSINCICWLGSQFAEFGGFVPFGFDEEEWISALQPTRLGKPNCIVGRTLVSHFAFFPQRAYLDAGDLLDQYEMLCFRALGPEQVPLSHLVAQYKFDERQPTPAQLRSALEAHVRNGGSWVYARSDGPVICGNLTLLADGTLRGYSHDNESGWEFRDGDLCFRTAAGVVSTRFARVTVDNERLTAFGTYLLGAGNFVHVLTARDTPSPGAI